MDARIVPAPSPLPEATNDNTPEADSLKPQTRLVLEYLQAGRTLTPQIALNNLGVGSLTKRVSELNALGFGIKAETKRDFHGRRYKSYSLPPKETPRP